MSEARTIDTGTDDILARVEDRVAVLTMNRPKRRNAFSAPMLQGLEAALIEAETAADIGCVVLTGAEGATMEFLRWFILNLCYKFSTCGM